MKLQGAEKGGRVRPLSEPLRVIVLDGDDVREETARFRFVPPRIEHMCRALAEFYLRHYLGRPPGNDLIEDEQHLLMLSWSLRIDDGGACPRQVFQFPSVMNEEGTLFQRDQLLFTVIRDCEIHKNCTQASVLWDDYSTFQRNEFPTVATDEQLGSLVEDAKKKSLTTLLSEQGFWKLVRLMRGLVALHPEAFTPGNTNAG